MDEEYLDLVKFWQQERNNTEIQELPDDFYKNMAEYSKKIREQTRMLDKTTLKGKITNKEKEYVEGILRDLSRLRLSKIVKAELDGKPISSATLTPEEKTLHYDLRHLIASHRKEMKKIGMGRTDGINGTTTGDTESKLTQELKVVRFVKALPAIMGVDMKTYGPFKPEDVAALPEENAENLIRRGFARVVEIQP